MGRAREIPLLSMLVSVVDEIKLHTSCGCGRMLASCSATLYLLDYH